MPSSEPPAEDQTNGPTLGLLLIGIAAFFLVFATTIDRTGVSPSAPGPRMFPIALGLCLLGAGLWYLGSSLRGWRMKRTGEGNSTSGKWNLRQAAADTGLVNVVLAIAGLALYIRFIDLAGFSLSTVVFASLLLVRLGTRWWAALLIALTLVIAIRLLFEGLFQVYLPSSPLDLPF